MSVFRDSAIMGAATFIVGAVFMEVGDDEELEFDKTFPYIATFFSGAIGYYLLKKTNITETFSAEDKFTKEKVSDESGGRIFLFDYAGNQAKYDYDLEEKKGTLSFISSFDEERFGKGDFLPHAKRIEDIKGSNKYSRTVFMETLERSCEGCDEPISKNGVGHCESCFQEEIYEDKKMKYDYDEWHPEIRDGLMSNRYCRKCLYYMSGFGETKLPSGFDLKSANYTLGNAFCESHFNEALEQSATPEQLLKENRPKYSLYEIENRNPRAEIMLKRRGIKK